MSILPLTVPPKRLAQTISSTATSFKLNNIQSWNGNDLTPGDFGTEAFAVFINLTRTQIEIVKIDPATIADASITITARGLDYLGGETPDPSRQYAWASNETIVQLGTDAPQLFRDFMSESNPATVTALHTYDTLPQSAEVPTDPADFTTKEYVDGLTEPAVTYPINQAAHGFVVGDVIRIDGVNTFAKAQADSPANAEVVGIVTNVIDVDNFEFVSEGVITTGVPVYAAGTVLFLSRTTAGALVDTDTSTIGEVSFPLAVVSESGVRMYFHKYRPAVINSISGNPIASETVAGMVEQATPAQVAAKQDVGETGAPLFVVPSLIGGGVEQVAESFVNFDGSSVPKAMQLLDTNVARPMQVGLGNFGGFSESIATSQASLVPDYLNGGIGAVPSAGVNLSIPAGNNRAVVLTFMYTTGDVHPTIATIGAFSFTKINESRDGNRGISTWVAVIGDSASPQSLFFDQNGPGNSSNYYYAWAAYDKVDQSNPTTNEYVNRSALSYSWQSLPLQGYGRAVEMSYLVSPTTDRPATEVQRAISSSRRIIDADASDYLWTATTGNVVSLYSTLNLVSAGPGDSVTVKRSGTQGNFTGLTVGAPYYADADGAITDTPGGAFVGRAISATEIEIYQSDRFVGAHIYQTSSETIGTGNNNPMNFQAAKFDTHGFADLGGSNDRLTIVMDGYYMVGGSMQANTAGGCTSRIVAAGETLSGGRNEGDGQTSGGSSIVYLRAGDIVQIIGWAGSSGYTTTGNAATNLWVMKVG